MILYGLSLNEIWDNMIIRIVKLTFKQGHVDEFQQMFDVAKEKILSFDGCMGLELLRDTEQGNVFFTYSMWEAEEYLQEYRGSKIFRCYWEETKKMFLSSAEAWSLESLYKNQ